MCNGAQRLFGLTTLIRGNLKTRLALLIFAAIVPAFALYIYASYTQMQAQKNAVRESSLRLVRVMKASHMQTIEDAVGVLRGLSQFTSVRGQGPERCGVLETELAQKFPGYHNIGLATANGDIICTSQPWVIEDDLEELQFFKSVRATRDIGMGRYRIDPSHPTPYLVVGAPVFDAENRLDSVMFASLRLTHFGTLPAAAQLPPDSIIIVFDDSGLVLARFPDPQGWTGTRKIANAPMLRKLRAGLAEEGVVDEMGADGVPRMFAYSRLHKTPQQTVFLATAVPTSVAYAEARSAFWTTMLVLAGVSLLVLGIAWIGAQRLVVRKMQGLIRLTERVRGGDLSARSGVVHTRDEVGQLAVAIDAMAESIQSRVAALQQRGAQMRELKEMNDTLQACVNDEEVLTVARQFALRLFPGCAGLICLANGDGYFESRVDWNNPASSREFSPQDCWAVRRGKSYRVEDVSTQPRCRHVERPPPCSYICIPLVVHAEVLGLLHMETDPGSQGEWGADGQSLALAVAEPIALMLANLRLRDKLHAQAMRDGLTGLYNRRFMEESLVREASSARRSNSEIAILMIDIDHFKRFNDTFGHAAGDTLLREMGTLLQTQMRSSDLACRYGGEEFTVILPGTDVQAAAEIGEKLRAAAARLKVSMEGRPLGPITISVGVAAFPRDGNAWENVLQAADLALMQAKITRNRVVVHDAAGSSARGQRETV